MTEAEIRRIVQDTVAETLLKLGVDAEEPLEFQKDMQFVRSWRDSASTVKRQSLITAVGIFTAGILGLLWLAVRGGH